VNPVAGPSLDEHGHEGEYCWAPKTIFQNIPPGPFFTTVKLAVSLNLVFMYPVTMLPASKAIEEALSIHNYLPSCVLRLLIVAGKSPRFTYSAHMYTRLRVLVVLL
jgi:hypothetical protein